MRILQLLAGYDSAGLFGSIVPLIKELRKRGHEVEEEFIPLRTKTMDDVRDSAEVLASVVPRFRWADVVHVHTPTVHRLLAMSGIVPDGVGLVSSRHATGIPTDPEWRVAAKRTDVFVPVARFLMQEFFDSGVPAGKIMPVHNGIYTDRYQGHRAAAKRALGIAPENLVVGFTGRLSWVKNLRNTVGAVVSAIKASRLPAVFVIVGAGKEGAALSSLIEDQEWEHLVKMIGFVKNDELSEVLPAFDIAVHYSWTEACSISLIEYLASGSAVVVSSVPGNREVVGSSGVVVKLTPPALATAVQALLVDEDYRLRMQRAALDRAKMFDVRRTAAQMEIVYQMAMGRCVARVRSARS